jgi:hypothetical protein
MFNCVYNLRLKINAFLDVRGNSFRQLTDHDWLHDLHSVLISHNILYMN